ncbi:hypothetical protein FPSE_03394 [Fusarium pseudograminearum CS3096]|uniref:Uncharacterized protein n=1 Tax=Fusarium pseudograminearum (strain CS3096) TaxID=1028729 RepID=K3W1S2_FUSPC|nr:hypothetical protein FPSE_03394 [Fusarium pseudograminearum CS3096]EKJ76395.1 hypothetical protein FPSE_03394 [Fusarium pseudograminearum CS3096]
MATGWESCTGGATGLFSGGAAGVVTGAGAAAGASRPVSGGFKYLYLGSRKTRVDDLEGDQNRGSEYYLPRTVHEMTQSTLYYRAQLQPIESVQMSE